MRRNRTEERAAAYVRAVSGESFANYPDIINGFMERGIPADQISPRENVFTYDAWQHKGRQVRRGEKAVKILTFKPVTKRDKETGETESFKIPWTAYVFHISQTDEKQ